MVNQKSFYPYEYECFEKSNKNCLTKESFIVITSFLKVWNTFDMKMMKDYHDLYIKCDVSSLADVFEKFRNNNLINYGLC